MKKLLYNIKNTILVLMLVPVYGLSKNDVCPLPDFSTDKVAAWEIPHEERYLDKDQEIKDLGTDIVVKKFFNTPETLFNFVNLVYGNIDNALKSYRKNNNLENRAIFLVFKGGNVLRMLANGVFDLLPPKARDLLKAEYAQYFKRSDADFSVYVDEKKLRDLNYDKVLGEVSDLVFLELNKIREIIKKDPQKYFNLMQVKSDFGMKELSSFFDQLKNLNAIKDKDNEKWFNAKFTQLQFGDFLASPGIKCDYKGRYDYKYRIVNNKMVETKLSEKPDWIYNTDNRTIELPVGSDPNNTVKFFLLRSKVAFEYTYEKDGVLTRKPIGGELIDVSLPHRKDFRLREFLDNYDKEIAKYTLISPLAAEEKITINSYSPAGLAQDLQMMILEQFDRPWHGGPKYTKRVNRFFFMAILEMLYDYGLESVEAQKYLSDVKEKIIKPLSSLYPLNNSHDVVLELKNNIDQIALEYENKMAVTNRFWQGFGKLLDDLIKNPQADDREGFEDFLKAIEKNIDIAFRLENIHIGKILFSPIFKVEMDKLF